MNIIGAQVFAKGHQAKISSVIAQHPLNLVLNATEEHSKNPHLKKQLVLGDNLNIKMSDCYNFKNK